MHTPEEGEQDGNRLYGEPAPKAEARDAQWAKTLYDELRKLWTLPAVSGRLVNEVELNVITETIAAVRRGATSAGWDASHKSHLQQLWDHAIELTKVGYRGMAMDVLATRDYLAANRPQDITPARDPVALDKTTGRRHGHSKLVYDKATRTIVPVDPHPDDPVVADRPVALLLAEAARLQAIPYADTEYYTDHQERQRRARCYQDAAELLEKEPR